MNLPGKLYITVVCVLLTGMLISCGEESDQVTSASYHGDGTEEPRPVEAVDLHRDKLIKRVNGSGIIRGRDEVWSTSETQGTIVEVFVSPGNYVSKGDPLIKVEDNLAYWEMKRAEQQLKTSDFEYRGKKNSFENGAVSEIEYNRSYSSWFSSRAAYETALQAYEDCTLRAPISGHVSQMDTTLTAGNILNRGTPVMKIINTDEFLLNIALGQREVGLVTLDSPVAVTIELADRVLQAEGRVLDISTGSDGETGSFPLRVVWKNEWDSLVRPGMTARVELQAERGEEGIIIPYDSILEREGKKWVFVALTEGDGVKAYPREIQPGSRLGNRIRIDEGLEEGESLIISALSTLYPGAPVELSYLNE